MDVIELGQDIAKGTDLWSSNLATVYYNDFPIEHPFYIGFFHGFSIMFDSQRDPGSIFQSPFGAPEAFPPATGDAQKGCCRHWSISSWKAVL